MKKAQIFIQPQQKWLITYGYAESYCAPTIAQYFHTTFINESPESWFTKRQASGLGRTTILFASKLGG